MRWVRSRPVYYDATTGYEVLACQARHWKRAAAILLTTWMDKYPNGKKQVKIYTQAEALDMLGTPPTKQSNNNNTDLSSL